jgi:hypothetical protein
MINEYNRRIIMKEQKRKHKIVLIGHSHIKGFSNELKQNVGDTCEIMGFVKPITKCQCNSVDRYY